MTVARPKRQALRWASASNRGARTPRISTTSIFPTIAELANGGVPRGNGLLGRGLDGVSLKANLLEGAALEGVALSTWLRNVGVEEEDEAPDRHFAVRTETHRMIAYGDGSRELYDHRVDPYEFTNLMWGSPPDSVRKKVAALESHLPKPEKCVPRASKAA